MTLPRPRFRLRWLMALVAVVAASLAAETTRQRWVYLRRLAAYHAHAEACYAMAIVPIQRDIEEGERLNRKLSVTELAVERASEPFHRLLDSKAEYQAYRKLVNLPWKRSQRDSMREGIAAHAMRRREYEREAARCWLPFDPPW